MYKGDDTSNLYIDDNLPRECLYGKHEELINS